PSDKIFVYNTESGLLDNNVLKLEKGKNNELWIGYSTTNISNLKAKKITHYKTSFKKKHGITSILFDKDKLWFSSDDDLFVIKSNKQKKLQKIETEISEIFPNDIIKTTNGLWIAISGGILKLQNNKIAYKSSNNSNFAYRTHALFLDKDSSLLIGGLNGLWRYKNNKFINLGIVNPILSTRITKIKRINTNIIGLGTKGYGLFLYSKDTIVRITKNDGLLSNVINSIYIQNKSIWLATNNGLSKIQYKNLNNYSIENYSDYNGFVVKEVNDVCIINDTVYAATNKGLVYFKKTNVLSNNHPPPIIIKNIKIQNNTEILKSTYNLSYNQNFINIKYIGLSYRKAGNLQYKYRMIGIDTNWIYTTETNVQYTTLPHGNYVFEVSAMNEDGVWSSKLAKVHFNISPPYYKTWWFIVLSIIFATTILYLIYYSRIIEIKNKNKLKNNIIEYKQQILRQQMNPHFIFNTLNSIQYFLLDKDTDSSLDYLSKFAKLMRMILENTQHATIAINDEIKALKLYLDLESLRFEDNFTFNIKIDDKINTLDWKMPSLLLQPYVENSIKHGFSKITNQSKGLISIEMKLLNNSIICSIEDNGIGRTKANSLNCKKHKKHKSLGSKITDDRVYLINSLYGKNINVKYIDKKDDKNQALGTLVEIIIPIII
ncbi:MAG: histidine kinase, partial [Bacteroidales bacterium]|nr:histidine kinase [Bacteroidales bacterium]